nr:uncharacterized mitochondrial protein AtMg00810-like [Tanacetum cinerariifolium]
KKVGFIRRLATPKPRKPRFLLRWSPTGKMFDQDGKLVVPSNPESHVDCSNGCSKHMTGNLKLLINFVLKFMGTVRFGNDHVAAILGFSDLQNLKGVDLLSGNRTTNLYTINLHEMVSASPICLMDHASSTKSWLWHQRLSHLNFDTINNLAKNILVSGLPKFKYRKEHLYPSCEQGKVKEHLTHLNLIQILGRVSSVRTPQQNGVMERKNQTLVEAVRTMLIFFRATLFLRPEAIATAKPDISFLYVFGALCYPKNDREDIRKLGTKGDIGFFIGYSADSCAYRIYNQRTNKVIETMNVTFDELSAMAFEQRSLKPELHSMTSGQITMYDDYVGGQPSAYSEICSGCSSTSMSTMEPKNVKEAMTNPAWIESMQEELLQFNKIDSIYVLEIHKKYGMESCDPVGTPIEIKDKLDLDQNGTPTNATKYRSMISALMYLTSSRPDIVHATCLCARYQAKPTEKHLKEVKRIFRYLQGTINTGLWYAKDSGFELTGFSYAHYAGCKDTFKSTSGGA